MPSARKPELTSGQSLDVQPGVANIGENRATLEALRNANIDGQDTYPTSVSAQRISSGDIDVSGLVRSGTMLVGSGGVTVTSDADGGTPATGVHLSSSTLQLIKAGVPQVTLNGVTGDATFIGTITATAGSFPGSLMTGFLNVGAGGIVIASTNDGSTPATGIIIDGSKIRLRKAGVDMITLDGTTGDGTFKGAITASTITSMTSVNFGTAVTIGGNLTVNANLIMDSVGSTTRVIQWDGSSPYATMEYDASTYEFYMGSLRSTGSFYIVAGTAVTENQVYIQMAGAAAAGNATFTLGLSAGDDLITTLRCGSSSDSYMYLQRGSTTVISFAGNSNTVTFAGDVIAGAGADYVVTGPDATTPLKINQKLLSVSVTGTGNFGTGTWTHGWDTSTEFVSFSATLMDFDTTKSTGISNVRVERTSATTCKVEFLVATYVSTQTIYVDVIAVGPV